MSIGDRKMFRLARMGATGRLCDCMGADHVTRFARVDFHSDKRVFGIKDEDRLLHVYVIGKTGTGKSTLMENMALTRLGTRQWVRVDRPAPRSRRCRTRANISPHSHSASPLCRPSTGNARPPTHRQEARRLRQESSGRSGRRGPAREVGDVDRVMAPPDRGEYEVCLICYRVPWRVLAGVSCKRRLAGNSTGLAGSSAPGERAIDPAHAGHRR